MNKSLSTEEMLKLVQFECIESVSYDELASLFLKEPGLNAHIPVKNGSRDPLTGDFIIYNPRRASRPHTTRVGVGDSCPICSGQTTGILDISPLTEGYSFINKNLFPVFYPYPIDAGNEIDSRGFHFLQWSSTNHDSGWQNMISRDLESVIRQLARLEKYLLTGRSVLFPDSDEIHVSIIKNFGRPVGGSLTHDHQQIGCSPRMPARTRRNKEFLEKRGICYPLFLLNETPPSNIVRDYGKAVLLVSPFMQRPLYMSLVLKDPGKNHIHQIDNQEITAVALGLGDAVRAVHLLMPEMGRETAFNIVVNNGASGGISIDILPFTQEFGGFEHLGLYLCQMEAGQAAEKIRKVLEERCS